MPSDDRLFVAGNCGAIRWLIDPWATLRTSDALLAVRFATATLNARCVCIVLKIRAGAEAFWAKSLPIMGLVRTVNALSQPHPH